MAKVFLTTVAKENPLNQSWDRGAYAKLLKSASISQNKKHILIDDPEKADIILFAELGVATGLFDCNVLRHPLFRKYKEKCFMFMNNDSSLHLVRGVYTSFEKGCFLPSRLRAGFYISNSENPWLDFIEWNPHAAYLFSFLGSLGTHPIRPQIAAIKHPRFYCKDTENVYREASMKGDEILLEKLYKDFISVMHESHFVLCPRGVGCSSVRLFETMKAGRVPVIISDGWIPPLGPDWDSFSIRIAENKIGDIPDILERAQCQAPEMAKKARLVWEQWFAPPVILDTIVDMCLDIESKQPFSEKIMYYINYMQVFRPKYLLRFIKHTFYNVYLSVKEILKTTKVE